MNANFCPIMKLWAVVPLSATTIGPILYDNLQCWMTALVHIRSNIVPGKFQKLNKSCLPTTRMACQSWDNTDPTLWRYANDSFLVFIYLINTHISTTLYTFWVTGYHLIIPNSLRLLAHVLIPHKHIFYAMTYIIYQ